MQKNKKINEKWGTSHNCYCYKPSQVIIISFKSITSARLLPLPLSREAKVTHLNYVSFWTLQISPVTALLPDPISFCSCPNSLCSSYTGLSVLPQPTGHPILCMGLSLPVMLFHMKQGWFTQVLHFPPSSATFSLWPISTLHLILHPFLPSSQHFWSLLMTTLFFQSTNPLLTVYAFTSGVYCLLTVSFHKGGICISVHWCVPICLRATPNKHSGAQWVPTKWMND